MLDLEFAEDAHATAGQVDLGRFDAVRVDEELALAFGHTRVVPQDSEFRLAQPHPGAVAALLRFVSRAHLKLLARERDRIVCVVPLEAAFVQVEPADHHFEQLPTGGPARRKSCCRERGQIGRIIRADNHLHPRRIHLHRPQRDLPGPQRLDAKLQLQGRHRQERGC